MGKHVDSGRFVDDVWEGTLNGHGYAAPRHRKPGPPAAPLGHRTFLDVWSGDPDTDRAWAHEPAPYVCHGRIGWDN